MLLVGWLQWRWRNEEILGNGQPMLQEKLRQATHYFEEDELFMKLEGLQSEARYKAIGPFV